MILEIIIICLLLINITLNFVSGDMITCNQINIEDKINSIIKNKLNK